MTYHARVRRRRPERIHAAPPPHTPRALSRLRGLHPPRLPAPFAPPPKRRGATRRAATPRPTTRGRWLRDLRAPGGRVFDVYLPAGVRRRARVPLVVLLHGCRQTPAEFADATRFTATADRNGIVLALPRQEGRHHVQRCWRWYEAAHQHRGGGEPAALVGIVRQVLAEDERWRIDPRRVYVAGLSAGGAMALTLASTYPDVFAAAGVHSAPPYRSATHVGQALPAMSARTDVPVPEPGAVVAPTVVVQGGADSVVRAANGDRVVDQWLAHAAVTRSRTTTGRSRDGRAHRTTRWYTADGRKVLEYWLVDGLGHAWSGGRAGGSYSDPAGPRAATLMWQFFRLHRLDPPAGAGSRVS